MTWSYAWCVNLIWYTKKFRYIGNFCTTEKLIPINRYWFQYQYFRYTDTAGMIIINNNLLIYIAQLSILQFSNAHYKDLKKTASEYVHRKYQ